MSSEDLLALRQLATRIPLRDEVLGYAWALVRASRPASKEAPEFVERWVEWGAGPRATLTLVSCAKARAILHGRCDATVEDVQELAKPALRHRIAGNYAALANNLTNDRLVDMLLEAVPPDRKYEKPPDESTGRGR
jgi:MoxR-like ATPase